MSSNDNEVAQLASATDALKLSNTDPDNVAYDAADDDDAYGEKTDIDSNQRGLLMHLISQLRVGMDLTKITIPAYFLEPRSLLEKLTDFLSHPQFVLEAVDQPDPVQRMLGVCRWYVSGWHIRPKGVKKPYNPKLGEIFRCHQELEDGTIISYFAEQVSHHPPVSSFYGECRSKDINYSGWYCPRSKFLGNSTATHAEGLLHINFNKWNEKYVCTWPTLYARGILIGTMLMENGGKTSIECKETGLVAEMEFKTKGFWHGEYNVIVGKIKSLKGGKAFYEFEGKWNGVIKIRPYKSKEETEFFNARKAKRYDKIVPPLEEQAENESRKLWLKVSEAILMNDIDLATKHKNDIENKQREEKAERDARGETYQPKYFVKDEKSDSWKFIGDAHPKKLMKDYEAAQSKQ